MVSLLTLQHTWMGVHFPQCCWGISWAPYWCQWGFHLVELQTQQRGHIPHHSSSLLSLSFQLWMLLLTRVGTSLLLTESTQNALWNCCRLVRDIGSILIFMLIWKKNSLSACWESDLTQTWTPSATPPPKPFSGCCPLGLSWRREKREDSVWPHTDSCTLFVSYIRS